jgi:hypothetical protein
MKTVDVERLFVGFVCGVTVITEALLSNEYAEALGG